MSPQRFPRLLCLPLLLGLAVLTACGSTPEASATTASAPPDLSSPTSNPSATATTLPSADVAIPVAGHLPDPGQGWFLTVGDSITSGFTVDPQRAGKNLGWPVQLQTLLNGSGRAWQLYDTACPGETTASFFAVCPQHDKVGALPSTSQYQTDLDAIAAAPKDLRLIVVDLGSNDLLSAARNGADPASVAAAITTHLDAIVTKLQTAAPGVPVIIANFYDPFENVQDGRELTSLAQINVAVASMAHNHGAALADFFAVINTGQPPNLMLCTLIDCAHGDIHPTVAGHAALAHTVLAVIP